MSPTNHAAHDQHLLLEDCSQSRPSKQTWAQVLLLRCQPYSSGKVLYSMLYALNNDIQQWTLHSTMDIAFNNM